MGGTALPHKLLLLRLACAALLLLSLCVHADPVVVVSSTGAVDVLSRDQVADIFMGRVNSFPGGGSIVPLDQPENSAIREIFYTKVVGRSTAQAKARWSRMAFTGKGIPPRECQDSEEVKKLIAAYPGMIGYIEKSAVDGRVKVVNSGN